MNILLFPWIWKTAVSQEKLACIHWPHEDSFRRRIQQFHKNPFYCIHQWAFSLEVEDGLAEGPQEVEYLQRGVHVASISLVLNSPELSLPLHFLLHCELHCQFRPQIRVHESVIDGADIRHGVVFLFDQVVGLVVGILCGGIEDESHLYGIVGGEFEFPQLKCHRESPVFFEKYGDLSTKRVAFSCAAVLGDPLKLNFLQNEALRPQSLPVVVVVPWLLSAIDQIPHVDIAGHQVHPQFLGLGGAAVELPAGDECVHLGLLLQRWLDLQLHGVLVVCRHILILYETARHLHPQYYRNRQHPRPKR